jgi:hypothetical protein
MPLKVHHVVSSLYYNIFFPKYNFLAKLLAHLTSGFDINKDGTEMVHVGTNAFRQKTTPWVWHQWLRRGRSFGAFPLVPTLLRR